MKPVLTEKDLVAAARALKCDVAVIKAIAEIESRGSGFLANGEPIILYEPHIFSRLTNRKYNRSHPDLSYTTWKRGAYGSTSAQHGKLARAVALDRDAALQSCSWGRFQVMGFNWRVCGYPSLQAFVNDMYASEQGHLRAFVGYIRGRGLADELQRLDFAGIGYGFNGAAYAQNGYDVKLARAYAKHKRLSP